MHKLSAVTDFYAVFLLAWSFFNMRQTTTLLSLCDPFAIIYTKYWYLGHWYWYLLAEYLIRVCPRENGGIWTQTFRKDFTTSVWVMSVPLMCVVAKRIKGIELVFGRRRQMMHVAFCHRRNKAVLSWVKYIFDCWVFRTGYTRQSSLT